MTETADAGDILDPTLDGRSLRRGMCWSAVAIAGWLGWQIGNVVLMAVLASTVAAYLNGRVVGRVVADALAPYRDGRPLRLRTILTGGSYAVLKQKGTVHTVLSLIDGRVALVTLDGRLIVEGPAGDFSIDPKGAGQSYRLQQRGGEFAQFRLGKGGLDVHAALPFARGPDRGVGDILDEIRAAHTIL